MNELEKMRQKIEFIDQELASLFEQRMQVVKEVAHYKSQNNLPILDSHRESYLIQKNSAYLKDSTILDYYQRWLLETMKLSKEYQQELLQNN